MPRSRPTPVANIKKKSAFAAPSVVRFYVISTSLNLEVVNNFGTAFTANFTSTVDLYFNCVNSQFRLLLFCC